MDQQALDQCFTPQALEAILDFILTQSYTKVDLSRGQKYLAMQSGLEVEQIQLKRYSAKILTLLFRDYLNANNTLKNKLSKPNAKTVYLQSLQLLEYFLPFYLKTITLNPLRYSEGT